METPTKITIDFIPHNTQRYETVGDYFFYPNGELVIRVSKLGDKRMELLVAVHELLEVILTENRGIPEQDIMAFDMKFEKERVEGKHKIWEEPGHDKNAPYRNEHIFAENIERLLASELKVDWSEYEKKLMEL